MFLCNTDGRNHTGRISGMYPVRSEDTKAIGNPVALVALDKAPAELKGAKLKLEITASIPAVGTQLFLGQTDGVHKMFKLLIF